MDVAGTGDHTCALDAMGRAWCWGENFGGQLGDGTTETRLSPVPVVGISNAIYIWVDIGVSVAALRDGRVMVWGVLGGPVPVELPLP